MLRDKGMFGGSDIAAITGLSPYKSPFAFWAEATGKIPPPEFGKKAQERMRQGQDLEAYVASRFEEATGKRVHCVNAILTSEEHPRLFASIDRKVSGEKAGLECKRVGDFRADKIKGGVPAEFYAQCAHYMAVTGYERWYLAILSPDSLAIHVLSRKAIETKPEWADSVVLVDDGDIKAIDEAAEWMAGLIESDTPPPADGADSTSAAIGEMFPGGGEACDLSPVRDALEERARLLKDKAAIEAELAAAENKIKAFMGNAETAATEGWRVSWKPQVRQTIDKEAVSRLLGGTIPLEAFKASTTRTLRITAR